MESDPINAINSQLMPPLIPWGETDEDRRAAYRQLFKIITSEDELTTIRDATNKGWALGNNRFAAEIEALSARRAVSKGRGRPRTRLETREKNVRRNTV